MALTSLAFLVAAVFLGFFRKMNAGLVAIALSLVLGRMAGISDKDIIAGFNYQLFIMLLGVTYLFSLAQLNGCLELLAKKVIALAGRRTWLVPILIYVFSTVLAAIGPGCIPTIAIMTVFSMALAAQMKIHPAVLSVMITLGASGGGVSPLAATGIIGIDLCAQFGLTGIETRYLINGILSSTVCAAVLYVAFGCWRLRSDVDLASQRLPAFNTRQKVTLAAIGLLVLLVMVFKVNVGLAGFAVAALLAFFRISNEREAVARIPWGTLLLITGVGMLISLIVKMGGIRLLSDTLSAFLTKDNAAAIMGVLGGCMAWVSSSSGVVMPTLLPTIPDIVARLGGGIEPLELANAITMVAHCAGNSPLSTGGALALAAYTSAAGASAEEQQKLFVTLFALSAAGVVLLGTCAYFGLYRVVLMF